MVTPVVFVVFALGFSVLPGRAISGHLGLATEAQLRPSFDYAESRGCFDIDVYSVNKAKTEVLSVQLELNPKKPPSAASPLVINLADRSTTARVQVHVYRTEKHDWPCSDVSFWGAEQPTTWEARRGTLTVVTEKPRVVGGEYQVTVRITNAQFSTSTGATISPPSALEIKTLAGRMVGG